MREPGLSRIREIRRGDIDGRIDEELAVHLGRYCHGICFLLFTPGDSMTDLGGMRKS